MRIALCIEYPIDQSGGTEVLVTELIKGLASRHELVLVSPDTPDSLRRSPVAPFVARHIPCATGQATPTNARALADRLTSSQPSLIHFHFGGNYAWGNRWFRNCPVVYLNRNDAPCIATNHGAFSILEGYCWHLRSLWVKLGLLPPAWWSKQYVTSRLDCEVAVSQHDYHALRRWYPPIRGKFRWIYHSRLQEPPPLANPSRQNVILCAGTIGHRKGQLLLVQAFRDLAADFPAWQLALMGRVGDQHLMGQINAFISEHGLQDRVQLLGRRSDEELTQWLGQAAIFAMPSLHEGLGLSLQEAQFHGCACVASAAGGVVDLLQDGDNGLLVPVGQVPPLREALRRLMRDTALRNRLSTRGPASVLEKGMTAPRMVQAYERLYAEILAARQRK